MQDGVPFLFRCNNGVLIQQQLYKVPHLVFRGNNQRRGTFLVSGIHVSTVVNQHLGCLERFVGTGYMQRCPAKLVKELECEIFSV